MPSFADPGMMVKQLPLLILLTLINIYVLFQVPHLTMSIFSGSTGGNGSGLMYNRSPSLKGLISEARAMNSEATTSPEMTRAAERYLEQYGDPMVMNTYLKIAVLALSAVAVALTGVVYKSHQALASAKPLIIRIDNVGRAEAIDYRDFQYRPQEAENKYYLGRWAELYFSRNRFTLVRDQTASLYFMNSDVQRDVIEQERKAQTIPTYLKDSGLPYVTIVVKNVILRRPENVPVLRSDRV